MVLGSNKTEGCVPEFIPTPVNDDPACATTKPEWWRVRFSLDDYSDPAKPITPFNALVYSCRGEQGIPDEAKIHRALLFAIEHNTPVKLHYMIRCDFSKMPPEVFRADDVDLVINMAAKTHIQVTKNRFGSIKMVKRPSCF